MAKSIFQWSNLQDSFFGLEQREMQKTAQRIIDEVISSNNLIVEAYLIFVNFLHEQNLWRIKFTPKKCVNYDKILSKLPILCVITAKYTVNCQIFALNLKKFTTAKKNLHEYIRGVRDKYEV